MFLCFICRQIQQFINLSEETNQTAGLIMQRGLNFAVLLRGLNPDLEDTRYPSETHSCCHHKSQCLMQSGRTHSWPFVTLRLVQTLAPHYKDRIVNIRGKAPKISNIVTEVLVENLDSSPGLYKCLFLTRVPYIVVIFKAYYSMVNATPRSQYTYVKQPYSLSVSLLWNSPTVCLYLCCETALQFVCIFAVKQPYSLSVSLLWNSPTVCLYLCCETALQFVCIFAVKQPYSLSVSLLWNSPTVCPYLCCETALQFVRIFAVKQPYSLSVSLLWNSPTVCLYLCCETALQFVRIFAVKQPYSLSVSLLWNSPTVCPYLCCETALQFVCIFAVKQPYSLSASLLWNSPTVCLYLCWPLWLGRPWYIQPCLSNRAHKIILAFY